MPSSLLIFLYFLPLLHILCLHFYFKKKIFFQSSARCWPTLWTLRIAPTTSCRRQPWWTWRTGGTRYKNTNFTLLFELYQSTFCMKSGEWPGAVPLWGDEGIRRKVPGQEGVVLDHAAKEDIHRWEIMSPDVVNVQKLTFQARGWRLRPTLARNTTRNSPGRRRRGSRGRQGWSDKDTALFLEQTPCQFQRSDLGPSGLAAAGERVRSAVASQRLPPNSVLEKVIRNRCNVTSLSQ